MKDEGQPPRDLRERTRSFAIRVMRLGDSLPHTRSANVVAYQLIKAGSSVGAHYREAMRARSDSEVISKFEGALMELEESAYWLSAVEGLDLVPRKLLEPLLTETSELTAIFVTCVRKIKARTRPKR